MQINPIVLIAPPCDRQLGGFKTTTDHVQSMGPYPPLGLLSLAAAAKNNFPGSDIRILDGQILSKEAIVAELNGSPPYLVGISPSMDNYREALDIARLAKALDSQVVFGGPHASGLAEEIMMNRGPRSGDYCVDAVVKGDGEEAICALMEKRDRARIDNLVWQDENGRIIENKVKGYDINRVGFIDRDYVDVEQYFRKQPEAYRRNGFKRGLTMLSRKGCAWRAQSGGCIFCNRMNDSIGSEKKPELFWDEVIRLTRRYGIDFLWDVRDDFLEDENWLENLVSVRPSPAKLEGAPRLQIFARIDKVNERTVKLAKNLNLPLRFVIGFESGSDKMLKAMNKGYSIKDVMPAVGMLINSGNPVSASFVLGGPGEDQKTLADTFDFACRLRGMGVDPSPQILKPFPNSRVFDLVVGRHELKYANKDLLDNYELIKDWISDFCVVGLEEISLVQQKITALRNEKDDE